MSKAVELPPDGGDCPTLLEEVEFEMDGAEPNVGGERRQSNRP